MTTRQTSTELTKSETLLDLASEVERVEMDLIAAGGELTPELEARWEAACGALIAKVDSAAIYALGLKQRAARAKEMVQAVKARQSAIDKHLDRLLNYVDFAMGEGGKLEGEVFRFKRVNNPVSVEVLDEDVVFAAAPEAFDQEPILGRLTVTDRGEDGYTVTRAVLSKVKLKALLESGSDIPGAMLKRGHRVEVRCKEQPRSLSQARQRLGGRS